MDTSWTTFNIQCLITVIAILPASQDQTKHTTANHTKRGNNETKAYDASQSHPGMIYCMRVRLRLSTHGRPTTR